MASAFESRHMGSVVRAYRTHPFHQRTFSQAAVAVWIDSSQTAVGRFENGPPEQHLDKLCHWARVLDIPENLLWFKLPEQARREHTVGSDGRGATEPGDTATAFVRRVAAGAVHDLKLDQTDADISRLALEFVSQPLGELRRSIQDLQADVFTLVESSRFPDQMRRLYLAASRVCGLEAHAYLDLGNYSGAARQAEAAWLCAELAGHPPMLAWLRSLQSLIAYWDGRLVAALSLARNGSTHASTGSVAVRLAGLEARACAALGDVEGTLGALRTAESIRALTDSEDDVGVFAFPSAKQAVYAATALLTLQDDRYVDEVIGHATQALALYDSGPTTDRSSGDTLAAHLDIAAAHLIRGDLIAVQEEVAHVVVADPGRRTASIARRARLLRDGLKRADLAPAVRAREIGEQLDEFCAHTLPRTDRQTGTIGPAPAEG